MGKTLGIFECHDQMTAKSEVLQATIYGRNMVCCLAAQALVFLRTVLVLLCPIFEKLTNALESNMLLYLYDIVYVYIQLLLAYF